MDLCMRGTGELTVQMAEEGSYIRMVTFTKECGSMTKLRVMESICTMMELDIPESGKTISSTVMVKKRGLTEQSTRATMSMASNKVEDCSLGQTTHTMTANSTTIISKVKASTAGPMADHIEETGKETKCTVKATSSGLMEEAI